MFLFKVDFNIKGHFLFCSNVLCIVILFVWIKYDTYNLYPFYFLFYFSVLICIQLLVLPCEPCSSFKLCKLQLDVVHSYKREKH